MNQGIDFDETPESFRFPGEESSTSSNLDNDDTRQQALKAELQPVNRFVGRPRRIRSG